jgi:hypothetical protein
MTVFSILFLLALTTQTPSPEPPISAMTVTYDKFDDITLIRLGLGEFTDDRGTFVGSMLTSHSGKVRPEGLDSQVVLSIHRYGQRWEFLNEHQIRIVCGDDRIEHNSDHYSSNMKDGDCHEYLGTCLNRATLKNCLAKNQDIEVRIGYSKPIPFMARARDKMKIFLEYLDKYPSSQ